MEGITAEYRKTVEAAELHAMLAAERCLDWIILSLTRDALR